ncbi:MAG: gamma-glutamylcyclotransferase family protein [Balneolaceae bacterium]|nr:gamma-glutamylcyclotransferase family protein [Balneolaceae bacterium]
MSTDHIFVYGSLRREFRSPARKVLDNHAEFVGEATLQGKLYMIDWYPGVVESNDPGDIVYGEVYKIKNENIVLTKLDRYEGCSPADPKPHQFTRKEKRVKLNNGKDLLAWVYLFVSDLSEKEQISSGDYTAFQKK